MKIGFSLLAFLFFLNVDYNYGQNSGLELKITKTEVNGLELKCELKNVSSDTISIDQFCVNSNGFIVEKPDGSQDGIGGIACGDKHKNLNVYPNSSIIWKIDLNSRYFETYLWGMRPRKSGTYKFAWIVNRIISEPFVYEYVWKE